MLVIYSEYISNEIIDRNQKEYIHIIQKTRTVQYGRLYLPRCQLLWCKILLYILKCELIMTQSLITESFSFRSYIIARIKKYYL